MWMETIDRVRFNNVSQAIQWHGVTASTVQNCSFENANPAIYCGVVQVGATMYGEQNRFSNNNFHNSSVNLGEPQDYLENNFFANSSFQGDNTVLRFNVFRNKGAGNVSGGIDAGSDNYTD